MAYAAHVSMFQVIDTDTSSVVARITSHTPLFNRSCIRNRVHNQREKCPEEGYKFCKGHSRVKAERTTGYGHCDHRREGIE